ncbi:hypothetical protein HPB47_020091 [Ixodes persulcatus]|uniref:Uncharacterized protein n=1 Tax=Ixodes persulcatus TaxID=34615 RepID=A0AC60QJU7_IXOPE|nr:hypothetical protein HPB47_020091 [Ixodes persulcatus]
MRNRHGCASLRTNHHRPNSAVNIRRRNQPRRSHGDLSLPPSGRKPVQPFVSEADENPTELNNGGPMAAQHSTAAAQSSSLPSSFFPEGERIVGPETERDGFPLLENGAREPSQALSPQSLRLACFVGNLAPLEHRRESRCHSGAKSSSDPISRKRPSPFGAEGNDPEAKEHTAQPEDSALQFQQAQRNDTPNADKAQNLVRRTATNTLMLPALRHRIFKDDPHQGYCSACNTLATTLYTSPGSSPSTLRLASMPWLTSRWQTNLTPSRTAGAPQDKPPPAAVRLLWTQLCLFYADGELASTTIGVSKLPLIGPSHSCVWQCLTAFDCAASRKGPPVTGSSVLRMKRGIQFGARPCGARVSWSLAVAARSDALGRSRARQRV